MKTRLPILVPLLLCLMSNWSFADVQITYTNSQDQVGKLSLSKKKVRSSHGKSNYIIVDYQKNELSVVASASKFAEKRSIQQGDYNQANNLNIVAVKKGKGPKIDGFKTTEYELQLNERYCTTVFTSKKLVKEKRVKKFLTYLQKTPGLAPVLLSGMSANSSCILMYVQRSNSFLDIGMPLKVMFNDQVLSEATKIKTKKKIKSKYYKIPDGYTVKESTQRSRQQAREQANSNSDISQNSAAAADEDESGEEEISSAEDVKEKLKEKRDKKKKKLKEKLKNLFD